MLMYKNPFINKYSFIYIHINVYVFAYTHEYIIKPAVGAAGSVISALQEGQVCQFLFTWFSFC